MTIDVSGSYVVPAGQTQSFDFVGSAFNWIEYTDPQATFQVLGALNLTSSSANAWAVAIDDQNGTFYPAGKLLLIGSGGVLSVSDTAPGSYVAAYQGAPSVENDGQVTLTAGATVYGFRINGESTFTNTGAITITGDGPDGSVAVIGSDGLVSNSGVITITAANAVALSGNDVVNSGTIILNTTTAASDGIDAHGHVTNSGTITAVIAVQGESFRGDNDTDLTNTGTLNGDVVNVPTVHNTGSIHGDVSSASLYDGRGGTISGEVHATQAWLGDEGETAYGSSVIGGVGNDHIYGGSGDDVLDGGAGDDVLDGGGGLNTISYASAPAGVTVGLALQGAAQNTVGAGNDILSNFQNLTGSAYADHLTGDANNNVIDGGAGGDDTLDGDGGVNTVSFASAASGVTVSLALQDQIQSTGVGSDTLSHFQNIIGSAFNDHLTGDGNGNAIQGGAGNDVINGGAGNDTIEGDSGDDVMDGGAGVNTVSYAHASWGVNVSLALQGQPQNTGAEGTDTLSNFENVIGSAFDDTIEGDSGNNVLDGGGGTNTVSYAHASAGVNISLALQGQPQDTGGAGVDTLTNFQNIIGSAFNDTLEGHDTGPGFRLDGSGGVNTVSYAHASAGVNINLAFSASNGPQNGYEFLVNFQNIIGSAFNDTLAGDGGDNVLDGGGGVDTVSYASAGYDFGSGSGGVTVSLALAGVAQDTGGAGHDTLSNFENLIGTQYADILEGNGGDNVLDGGGGVNTVSYAHATSGVTVSLGLQGAAQNTIGAGNDTLSNFQNVLGSAFNDHLTGDANNNVIDGGGGGGDDVLDGGGGVNTVSYASAGAGVSVNLGLMGQAQNTGGAGTDTLSNFQNIIGSAFGDHLTGDANNNVIDGGAGDDVLDGGGGVNTVSYASAGAGVAVSLRLPGQAQNTGGGGHDTLSNFQNVTGSAFNDTIEGDSGNNVLDGGGGTNTVSYAHATAGVNVSLALLGQAQDTGGDGVDTLSNFSNVIGSAFNDTIEGSAGNEVLDGGGGVNTISYAHATSGVSVGLAAQAAPVAQYQSGYQQLLNFQNIIGSAYNDTLQGDAGNNVLTGGAGADQFLSSGGADQITDFSLAQQDQINLYSLHRFFSLADVLAASTQSGSDVVINLGNGAKLTLDNVQLSDLAAATSYSPFVWSNDHLVGTAGNDTFSFSAGSYLGPTEAVDGGGGFNTVNVERGYEYFYFPPYYDDLDFTAVTFTSIQALTFNEVYPGTTTAAFSSSQFGTGLSNALQVNGSPFPDYYLYNTQPAVSHVVVNMDAPGSFSAAGWTFGYFWSPGDGDEIYINGTSGDDTITAASASTTINGGDGNDRIVGGGGADMLDGGTGSNTVSYASASSGVTVSLTLQGGAQNTVGAGTDTLSNFQNLIGSAYADHLTGDAGNNVIDGGAGGNDVLDGGAGVNTVSFASAANGVTASLALQGQAQSTGVGSDTLSNFQNLTGSAFKDTLEGGGSASTTLTGGLGADTFVYRPGDGQVTIADFSHAQGDKLDFSQSPDFHSFNDVLAAAAQSGGDTVIALGGGARITLHGVSLSSLQASDVVLAQVANTDVNGDGGTDVLFRNGATGAWGFMSANASGGETWHAIGASSADYAMIGKGDFNGDGALDVAFRQTSTGDWGFLTPSASGGGETWHAVGPTSTAYAAVAAQDFDGDGTVDIAFRDIATGDWGFMSANPSGGGETWHAVGPSSTAYAVIGAGDFNGDGLQDLAFRNSSTGDWGFLTPNPSGGAETWHAIGPTSLAYDAIAALDFDGDGTTDIAFRNGSTGDWGFMSANASGGGETWRAIGPSSPDYAVIGSGDFNGDGLKDVAFRQVATGDWGYLTVNPAGGETWHAVGPSSTDYVGF
jgi:Ca2+-binding RTX toxin-like protein